MDIVDRLRGFGPDWTRKHNEGKPIPYETCADAADEIERLRAELARLHAKHGEQATADILNQQ